MKENGFTLVELIAVLVILSILAMLAAPNVINLMQSGKEGSFISDAEEMVSTATYMYKTQNTRGFEGSVFIQSGTNQYKILMSNINGDIPETDPYGYKYDKTNSYVSFQEPSDTATMGTRTISAHFKSCQEDDNGNITSKCHCINAPDATDIKSADIGDC